MCKRGADPCLGRLREGLVQRVGRGRPVAVPHAWSANAAQTQKGKPMAAARLAFGRVRGAPEELFIQITMDAGFSTIKHTSHPMTEGELRTFLQQHGLDNAAIASCIRHARQHPV